MRHPKRLKSFLGSGYGVEFAKLDVRATILWLFRSAPCLKKNLKWVGYFIFQLHYLEILVVDIDQRKVMRFPRFMLLYYFFLLLLAFALSRLHNWFMGGTKNALQDDISTSTWTMKNSKLKSQSQIRNFNWDSEVDWSVLEH